MIGRVLPRGKNTAGVLSYLFGKGKANEHTDPHLVAAWSGPYSLDDLEPPPRPGGGRSVARLAGLLDLPVQLSRGKVADKHVYHVAIRCAPGDPVLGDGAWNAIATEIMHRTGLSVRGKEDHGVRWVAVRHADDHVHVVATLATQDRRPAWPGNDYYRIGEALRDIEAEYGLQATARADRTAPKAQTRAEMEQQARTGRTADRAVLYRAVRAAAAAARTEPGFFRELADRGVLVRQRHSARRAGEVTGYAVALDHGPGRRPVWYSGGKLAADLTLPQLRRRWAGPPLTGLGMNGQAARAVLAREALRAARAARSEPEFTALLARAGLTARIRAAPDQAGRPPGWSVTLPGLADRAGQPVWFSGGRLHPALALGQLRASWAAGQAGAPPGPGYFDGADRAEVYRHAARAAEWAAGQLRAGRPGQQGDAARAAADVLTAAAEATGNPDLGQAAEELTRAARAAYGRTPAPARPGSVLRTAAYLLAACRRTSRPQPARAARQMLLALASLARTLAELRAAQDRRAQAAAALAAARRLHGVAASIEAEAAPAGAAGLAAAAFPAAPRPARPSRPDPAAGPRPRPRPHSPPGRGMSM